MANAPGDILPPMEEVAAAAANTTAEAGGGLLAWILAELLSPVNFVLTLICGFLAYRILRPAQDEGQTSRLLSRPVCSGFR